MGKNARVFAEMDKQEVSKQEKNIKVFLLKNEKKR